MKIRSTLLLVCLVVVPALAMFSHKIPAGTRGYLRRAMEGLVADAAAESPGPVAPGPPADASGTEVDSPPGATDLASGAAAVPPGHPPGSPTIAPPGPILAPAEPIAAVTPMFPGTAGANGSPGAVMPVAAPNSAQATPETTPMAVDRATLESRLRALGATHVEWTPGQGDDGIHRCSCRIPAEPSGQLHRVFQASASDPVAALDTLVGQVTAWSLRSRTDEPSSRVNDAGRPSATP